MADSHDPDQRRTDDPELEKIKEDTAQIFVQFVRLHSHSASSNAVAADRASPDPTTEPTTSPSPSSRQCLQVQESSRSATRGPSTLPRQKSREAARKDPHPKAVHSTRQPTAQIVPINSHEATPVSPSNSTKSRPDKLCLVQKHKRVPSSHSATGSDSSGKTTPAQDPPMELMSPELSSSYPPISMSTAPSMTAQSDLLREGLVRSAEHASVAAASAACTTSQERECHYASADKGGDPCAVKARMIADRLKIIGDEVEDEHLKSKLEELTIALGDAVMNNNTLQAMLLMYTQNPLSWRKIAELFKLVCRVMESTCHDDQLSLFEKVWYSLLDSVVPWIQNRGGWAALQRETEPRLTNTPNVPRRSHPLNPAQSEPVLLHDYSPTTTSPLCQPPFINGASTLGRVSEAGRIMYTPQMPRHRHAPPSREQSSPCLPRDRSNSQHSQHSQAESASGRLRLWSLTESGNFKREEDGVEDNEHSISELNLDTLNDDEGEAFVGSQEEEEGEEGEIEGESQQEAEKTLTASGFHASASFSSSSTSPPIIVPSPHSSSQPDAISMDEFHIDSGIDISSLSLSCSPKDRGVSFIVGGGGSNRPSSSVPRLNQTSLTSLSSVASASPVHTSPSSRKNSANGSGSSYFSNRTRPHSGGSLKESRSKHSGGDSPQCYRTSSLRGGRSRPRHHQIATPTNETSGQSAASSGHSSWMETPVRRMSTSAAVIYELVKDFFRSP